MLTNHGLFTSEAVSIYTDTSSLGHFGRWRAPEIYRWERSDRAEALRDRAGADPTGAASGRDVVRAGGR